MNKDSIKKDSMKKNDIQKNDMQKISKIADIIYFNGCIYTADAQNTCVDAIAIFEGKILSVGNYLELQKLCDPQTQQINLHGKMMMPGIIDGHMHPFWGGVQLSGCNLNYAALTVAQILAHVQAHLDQDLAKSPQDWLKVTAWLRQGMLAELNPRTGINSAQITRADLDCLNTERPVILFSNDCHTLLANTLALELLGIDANTPDPIDGKIGKDINGQLTGILEDAPAMRAYDSIPSLNAPQALNVARLVQKVLNEQGVTTVMDARVAPLQLDAFATLHQQDELTIRFQAAREIMPAQVPNVAAVAVAVANAVDFARQYDQVIWSPKPGLGCRCLKMFLDGVLQAPTMTAALLKPYHENKGSTQAPNWQASKRYGDLYFSAEILDELMLQIAKHGFDPHLHTVGDGAISMALNSIEKMRKSYPNKDIRPGLAHNELVDPHDYARFAALKVHAVLSFQWAAPDSDLIELERNMLGEERFENLEPLAKFIDAGAKIVFGSDWPIDALDEWYAFKVAATRTGRTLNQNAAVRLDNDRDLSILEILRAATIDSAYAQRREDVIGSLELGKFADLIILDRNIFDIPANDIENIKVLMTMVGGKIVYQA
ncbi:amidohydrolase [Gammaproteobacteria bacterium]|nr:amidohydrolase [Gammaproteobacteria bacterium]